MKIAVAGKGGVGKTTLAAALARRLAGGGRSVIAVDADPDGNLPAALGLPPGEIPEPIARMKELIYERTEAGGQGLGTFFKLNPKVDDLPERFSSKAGGVRVLVLGTVEAGGKGCLCPEGAVLRALLAHLLLTVPDDVILDMEAGLEHMGRASARGVDAIVVVIEPGLRSVQTAKRIEKLAQDIGISRVLIVANKIRSENELEALRAALVNLKGDAPLGVLPFSEELARADLEGRPVEPADPAFAAALEQVCKALDNVLEAASRREV